MRSKALALAVVLMVGIQVVEAEEVKHHKLYPKPNIEAELSVSTAGLRYFPLSLPCRAYDTPFTGTFIFDMVIRGFCGVPEEAEAITFTVAAWQPEAQGNILFWARGTRTTTTTLNFHPSVVSSSAGMVALCDRSQFECEADFLGQSTQTLVRMIFDVTGYYAQ